MADEEESVWLTVRNGTAQGKHVEIDPLPFVIGRSDDAHLTLPDVKVSRRHMEFSAAADGGLALKDLGSGNGTFVNGERVTKATLEGTEQVQLGDIVLLLTQGELKRADGQTGVGSTASLPQTQSALHRVLIHHGLRRVPILAGAAAALAIAATAFLLLSGDDDPDEVADAVKKATPSTVFVQSSDDTGEVVESGSGWVLDAAQGLIVTNARVINGANTFAVGTKTGLQDATIVGAAPCEDLAVLEVTSGNGLRSLPLGTQASLQQGQTVVGVGYPANASQEADLTSTSGVISVVRASYREQALDVPAYPNVIRTDAAVNPGKSGGPLVDLSGRLVGVNSAGRKISTDGRAIEGQAYAIGVDRTKQVVGRLRRGISPAWLGAGFAYPSKDDLRGPDAADVRLELGPAIPGTPIAAQNLQGAAIERVNGQRVSASLQSYCDAMEGIKPGATVRLAITRGLGRRVRTVNVRMP